LTISTTLALLDLPSGGVEREVYDGRDMGRRLSGALEFRLDVLEGGKGVVIGLISGSLEDWRRMTWGRR
jgi:hypothetical protein